MFYSINSYSSANSRKGISGLASGMDTDALVEKMTGGTRNKISNTLQKKALAEWRQEAYRGSIDKLANFKNKYFLNSSATYMGGSDFYNVRKITNSFGDYVTATGKADAAKDFVISSIDRLATTAQYNTANNLSLQALDSGDLQKEWRNSSINGNNLKINVGDDLYTLTLNSKVNLGNVGDDLATVMNGAGGLIEQLNEAVTRLNVDVDRQNYLDPEKNNAGFVPHAHLTGTFEYDAVTEKVIFNGTGTSSEAKVMGGSANLFLGLGFKEGEEGTNEAENTVDASKLFSDKKFEDVIAGQSIDIVYNGVTKKIVFEKSEMARYTVTAADIAASGGDAGKAQSLKFSGYLQGKVNTAFGSNKVKVDVTGNGKGLRFTTVKSNGTADPNSIVGISGSSSSSSLLGEGGALHIVQNETNRVNLNKSLGDYFSDTGTANKNGLPFALKQNADGNYRISVNGTVLTFNRDAKFGDIVSRINSSNLGVNILYSSTTDKYTISASDSGSGGRIEIKDVADADLLAGLTKGVALTGEGSTTIGGRQLYDLDGASKMGLTKNKDGSYNIGTQQVIGMLDDGSYYLANGDTVSSADLAARLLVHTGSTIAGALATEEKSGDTTTAVTDPDGNPASLYTIKMNKSLGLSVDDKTGYARTEQLPDGSYNLLRGITQDGILVYRNSADLTQDIAIDLKTATTADMEGIFGVDKMHPNTQGNLSEVLFGTASLSSIDDGSGNPTAGVTQGLDSQITISFDGNPANSVQIERSSNNFVIDGVNLELKKTTTDRPAGAPNITFGVDENSEELLTKIKTFVEDYNAVLDELNGKLTEAPATDENHQRIYKPLSQEEADDMSEEEVKTWTEKAKQGILYGDSNYNSLLTAMRGAVGDLMEGMDLTLAKIGISTGKPGDFDATQSAQSAGKLIIDEDKLRQSLSSDPESIMKLFTQEADHNITDKNVEDWTTEDRRNFHKQSGIVQRLNRSLQDAVGTMGGTGYMVLMAGKTGHTSSLDNFMSTNIRDINSQLSTLKNRLKSEEDRYYAQFAQMEQLIQNMNAQSSWLSQQTGG